MELINLLQQSPESIKCFVILLLSQDENFNNYVIHWVSIDILVIKATLVD